MFRQQLKNFRIVWPMLVALLLVIAVSCGGDDADTTAPAATALPPATTAPEVTTPDDGTSDDTTAAATAAPVPTSVPDATAAPAAEEDGDGPHGSLRVAFSLMGSYQAHPCTTGSPAVQFITQAAFEGLMASDVNGDYFGLIAKDWSVSEDNTVWTFNLNEGVQFHGGLGEMTSADVAFSAEQICAGSATGLEYYIDPIFKNPEGGMFMPDDYTLVTDTVKPLWDTPIWLSTPGVNGLWIVNKSQTEELVELSGMDAASQQLVGTGPWEMVENTTGEFWKFAAVEDHYRKTPFFAEMTFYEIPEEATRIANFQAGTIDTFGAAPDTIPVLADIPGTEFMSQAGVSESGLRLYGQYYIEPAAGEEPLPAYQPDELPWVSADPDPDSAEWERARKIREAMSISIDREKIVKELLHGEGAPLSMWAWMETQDKTDFEWEYDLDRAKLLMAEGGHPDGFDLVLNPVVRGAAVEVEACEAVGDMWADLGIKVALAYEPYGTLRPEFGEKTWKGATCHASGGYREPMGSYSFMWLPGINWSSGLEHPLLQPWVDEGYAIFDREERWEATMEIGQWVWDNTLDIGLYYQNNTYPLGPNLGSWADKLHRSDPRNLSALEWAPHR